MDANTLNTTRTQHHWSRGLTVVCWMIAVLPPAAMADKPVLHPGSQRYRVSAPPATGRSGSATLMARALLGKGGQTTVEVSTSTLDTATVAPGNISKLQIKLLDDQGRARGSENYTGLNLGGRLQVTLQGLGRGQPLQVQANIRGIDPARTDVVTVRAPVQRRPDLAVQQVSAPESAPAGMPVDLSALVEERNGDTGAEADCVLKVDGAEVDRASGIWIDAASAVSCAFSHTFSSGGLHVVTVEVADVVPGDDEPSNNEATTSLWVTDSLRFHHEASVDSSTFHTVTRQDGWYKLASSTQQVRSDWFQDYEYYGWRQSVEFRGELPHAISFPLTAFTLTHSSGGLSIPGTTFHDLEPDAPALEQCVWEVDPLSSAHLRLCTRTGPSQGQTRFTYTRYGGEVTYYSYWHQARWVTSMSTGKTSYSEWSVNNRETTPLGPAAQWIPGASYDFDVQVIDGDTKYRAVASVALTPYQHEVIEPLTCTGSTAPDYSLETCRRSHFTLQGVQGTYVSNAP
ncbi:MAG: hypothetical protein JXB05_21465 [Myxococcaceae bacterium]|nr:hypothetical protein [Myxococcaceae bacterium]